MGPSFGLRILLCITIIPMLLVGKFGLGYLPRRPYVSRPPATGKRITARYIFHQLVTYLFDMSVNQATIPRSRRGKMKNFPSKMLNVCRIRIRDNFPTR